MREAKYNPAFLAAVKNMGAHKGGAPAAAEGPLLPGPHVARLAAPTSSTKYAPGWTCLFWTMARA